MQLFTTSVGAQLENIDFRCNQLAQGSNPSSLELLFFDVAFVNGSVHLTWNTFSELNIDFFTIERSIDGVNWDFVEQLTGAGLSHTVNNYLGVDIDPYNALSYYRLKQTSSDGLTTLLKACAINTDNWLSDQTTIFPNPTKNTLRIKGSLIGRNDWSVFDRYGRNVLNQVSVIEIHKDLIVLDLSYLKSGDYYFMSKNITEHIIKL